jgi:hypothetical protein
VCSIAGNGFIVAEESEELGDTCCTSDVLRACAGESLYDAVVVFWKKVSWFDIRWEG